MPLGEVPESRQPVQVPTRANRVLQNLPPAVRAELEAKLERVELSFRQTLYEPNVPISHVYFPVTGVLSLVTKMADGTTIEVATVGNEGMIGLPVFLGSDRMPGSAFAQIPGEAFRLTPPVFQDLVRQHRPLADVMNRYAQALFSQVAQSAACNRVHPIDERTARWLLMTHDRVTSDTFHLTQDFLAQMLGTRRAAVNVAAGTLQKAGLIRYTRGDITIEDRAGLEAASCECYRTVREEYDRLLAPSGAGTG